MMDIDKVLLMAAKLVFGLKIDNEYSREARIARALAEIIANVREVYGVKIVYCNLCGKGPFTMRGLYLHVRRVHRNEIPVIIEKLERAVKR